MRTKLTGLISPRGWSPQPAILTRKGVRAGGKLAGSDSKLHGLQPGESRGVTSRWKRLRREAYWQASQVSPRRIASMLQAFFSSSENSRLAAGLASVSAAMPRTSFFAATVAFSMFEAPRLRR
jgi:hypothetical protein